MTKYRIASVETVGDDIRIFRMEPVQGEMLAFTAGHFVFLHVLDESGGTVVKRPYSIASEPDVPYLEFCIKLIGGELTGRLEKMGEGSVVGIEGPFGNFTYDDQPNAAFIAGGVGIAPFISILRHVTRKKLKGRFMLFYSSRRRDTIVYREELARLEKENPSIKVAITLTREEPAGWKGECGRIDEEMVDKYAANPTDFDWWLCGPMAMIRAMKDCLVKKGLDPKRIKIEGWG